MTSDHRAGRLLQLKDSVKAFFDVTGIGGSDAAAAFRAVRRNDHLAESFLAELIALVDYIEAEFTAAPMRRLPPPPPARIPARGPSLHDQETVLLDVVKATAGGPPASRPLPARSPAPSRPAPRPPSRPSVAPPRRSVPADDSPTRVTAPPTFDEPTGRRTNPGSRGGKRR